MTRLVMPGPWTLCFKALTGCACLPFDISGYLDSLGMTSLDLKVSCFGLPRCNPRRSYNALGSHEGRRSNGQYTVYAMAVYVCSVRSNKEHRVSRRPPLNLNSYPRSMHAESTLEGDRSTRSTAQDKGTSIDSIKFLKKENPPLSPGIPFSIDIVFRTRNCSQLIISFTTLPRSRQSQTQSSRQG